MRRGACWAVGVVMLFAVRAATADVEAKDDAQPQVVAGFPVPG